MKKLIDILIPIVLTVVFVYLIYILAAYDNIL